MFKREALINFVETYKKSIDIDNELNEGLLETCEQDEWMRRFCERSAIIREQLRKNVASMSEIYVGGSFEGGLDCEGMTREDALAIYDCMLDLYDNAYDDCTVVLSLAEPLIRFFEKENDLDHLIVVYQCAAFEITEYYSRVKTEESTRKPTEYYLKIIGLRDNYSFIGSERARRCFFTAFANLIAPIGQLDREIQQMVFTLYEQAMELWHDPDVQAMDGSNERFADLIEDIRENTLFAEDYIEELCEEDREKFCVLAKESYDRMMLTGSVDYNGAVMRAYYKMQELTGARDIKSVAAELSEYYLKELEVPDYMNKSDEENLELLLNHHNSGMYLLKLLDHLPEDDTDKQGMIRDVLKKSMQVHYYLPYHFYPNMSANVCAEWFKEAAGYVSGFRDKVEFLFRMIVCRQMPTYIHSMMVDRISGMIAEEIVAKRPELFVGLPGFDSVNDVVGRREELFKFISNAALLHDIGKTLIAYVINLQVRPITKEEFEMIKLHPELGLRLTDEDPMFTGYYDVMLGHHRSYDGTHGYPMSFDCKNSPYKSVTDLIRIADAMDAATDVFGRNYTNGKTFSEVMRELRAGMGTEYSPDIVELISDSAPLCESLRRLTGNGRTEVYYDVYQFSHGSMPQA